MSHRLFNLAGIMLLSALAPLANAALITIEPDDYAAGTTLTNISPYVTLESVFPTFPGRYVGDVYADEDGAVGNPEYQAPTGELTFGNHAFFFFSGEPYRGGFTMTFHQAVSNVSLLANNEYTPGLAALWAAYDYEGNIIGSGGAGVDVPAGDTFEVSIAFDNIWSVVVGGDASTAAINFDHLTFEVDDLVTVPAPAPLMLLLIGLAAVIARKRVC